MNTHEARQPAALLQLVAMVSATALLGCADEPIYEDRPNPVSVGDSSNRGYWGPGSLLPETLDPEVRRDVERFLAERISRLEQRNSCLREQFKIRLPKGSRYISKSYRRRLNRIPGSFKLDSNRLAVEWNVENLPSDYHWIGDIVLQCAQMTSRWSLRLSADGAHRCISVKGGSSGPLLDGLRVSVLWFFANGGSYTVSEGSLVQFGELLTEFADDAAGWKLLFDTAIARKLGDPKASTVESLIWSIEQEQPRLTPDQVTTLRKILKPEDTVK